MRWLFLVMLVLNLSYIAWETLNASKENVLVNVPPLPDVPTILLANKIDVAATSAVVPAEKDVPVAIVVEGEQASVASSENQIETEVEVEDMPMHVSATNQLAEQESVSLASSAEEDKLEGLSQVDDEAQANDKARADEKIQLSDKVPADNKIQAKIPDACFTLGPFRELDTLRALMRNIKEYVEEVSFRSRDEKESSLFWVYLSPLENRAQAKKVGQALKAKKIKDFYIIRSGDKKNGISLGQFRNKNGAYRLAKKVKKLDFSVEVEPVFKTYTLYWLDYRLINGNTIPEAPTAKYLTGKISRLSRSCGSQPEQVL